MGDPDLCVMRSTTSSGGVLVRVGVPESTTRRSDASRTAGSRLCRAVQVA